MTSAEENVMLTRTGAGTAMGELFRENKAPCEPFEIMKTAQSLAKVFLSSVRL